MATNIELIKKIKQNTINGAITWNNFVIDKNAQGMVIKEYHDISPVYDAVDETYYSYIDLENNNLILNTLTAKIISSGNYTLELRQENGVVVLDPNTSPNIMFGAQTVTVVGVYLDIEKGQLQFKWNASNDCVTAVTEEEQKCKDNSSKEKKHGLYVDYKYKNTSNIFNLSTVYYSGNTPWSADGASSLQWGIGLLNTPRSNQSVINVKKIITFRGNKEPDWVFEPAEGTVDFKEFNYLWVEVEKKITNYIFEICDGFPIP